MTKYHSLSPDALIDHAAGRNLERMLRAGATAYVRHRDLPGLIRFDPLGAPSESQDAAEQIVAKLEHALRRERSRARGGHWTYDLNRHIALRQAHRAETERLDMLRRASRLQASMNSVSTAKTGSRNAPDQSM